MTEEEQTSKDFCSMYGDYDVDDYDTDDDEPNEYARSATDEFFNLYVGGPMCHSCGAARGEFTDVKLEVGVHPICTCARCNDDVCTACLVECRFYDETEGEDAVREYCRTCAVLWWPVLED